MDELDVERIMCTAINGVGRRKKGSRLVHVHPEEDTERTLKDDSNDYHPIFEWPHSQFHAWVAAVHHGNATVGEQDTARTWFARAPVSDYTAAVRRFLENAGAMRHDERPMSLSEMRAYVRGRMNV